VTARNPSRDEIKYLAQLSAVRCDGIDTTQPVLARRLMYAISSMERVIQQAQSGSEGAEGTDAKLFLDIERIAKAVIADATGEKPSRPDAGRGRV
jgi:hypothetical protein